MTAIGIYGSSGRMGRAIAEQIEAAGEISPGLLIQTLRQGEITLFEDLFARLTGLDTVVVRRSIFEPGGEGLAIACKAIGISKSDFSDIFAFSRSAIPESVKDFGAEIRSVLKFFAAAQQESAETVLQRWKRDSNYLSALRDLELTS